MTGADFHAWRLRCGLTAPAAAKLLGVSPRTIFNLQKSVEVPLTTAIAADVVEIEINYRKETA